MKAIGTFFITEALMLGYIGPTSALVESNGAFIVLADYLIYGIKTDTMKIIGAALSILGVIWMMTGDIMLYKMK